MTKFIFILWFYFALFPGRAVAQVPEDDPKDNALVDCGSEKVAIFGATTSPDGFYALGWTMRPKAGNPPVDWSFYDRNDLPSWWTSHPTDDVEVEPGHGNYMLINGMLDLRAKRFVPFMGESQPYFPHDNHAGLDAVWFRTTKGTRYAVFQYNGKFDPWAIWLVEIGSKSIHAVDLWPAVEKKVNKFVQKHVPDNSERYRVSFASVGRETYPKPPPDPSKTGSIDIPFDVALTPDGVEGIYSGNVTVALPKGTVMNVKGKKL